MLQYQYQYHTQHTPCSTGGGLLLPPTPCPFAHPVIFNGVQCKPAYATWCVLYAQSVSLYATQSVHRAHTRQHRRAPAVPADSHQAPVLLPNLLHDNLATTLVRSPTLSACTQPNHKKVPAPTPNHPHFCPHPHPEQTPTPIAPLPDPHLHPHPQPPP